MSSKQIRWIARSRWRLGLLALAAVAQAEVAQKGTIRVKFDGQLTPNKLPRTATTPVKVSVAAKISPTNSKAPAPQMTRLEIEINKFGVLDSDGPAGLRLRRNPAGDHLRRPRGLPQVAGRRRHASPPTSRSPGARPFPADGKLYAFNGEIEGKPAVLAHVYGVRPAPVSFTLAFIIGHAKGKFGTTPLGRPPEVDRRRLHHRDLPRPLQNLLLQGQEALLHLRLLPGPEGVRLGQLRLRQSIVCLRRRQEDHLDPEPHLQGQREVATGRRVGSAAMSVDFDLLAAALAEGVAGVGPERGRAGLRPPRRLHRNAAGGQPARGLRRRARARRRSGCRRSPAR